MEKTSPNNGSRRSRGPVQATVNEAFRQARRVVIAVVGGTVLLVGLVMIVTPGPAVVMIPLGLAILAVEFAWARRLLKRVRDKLPDRAAATRNGAKRPADEAHGNAPQPNHLSDGARREPCDSRRAGPS
jgi:uncharacterized protein (TIGR02611 family)